MTDHYRLYVVVILMTAFIIRLSWVIFSPALPVSDFQTFHTLALRLAHGLGYVTAAGKPTAFRPPGYPFFISLIYRITGDSLFAAKVSNAVLSTLTCLFTYILADRVFGKKIAMIAALVIGFLPSHILYTSLLATENLFTPVLLASSVCFLMYLQDNRNIYLLLSGVLLGISSLVRPTSLLLPGTWFIFMLWKKYSLKRSLAVITALSAMIVVTMSPWIIRNAIVMKAFIPVATEGGVGFFCGYNEKADGHYDPYARRLVDKIGDERGLNEVERDKLAYKLAFEFIRRHPYKVILLAPLNIFHLFRDDVSGVVWNFANTTRPLPKILWYVLVGISQLYYTIMMIIAAISFFHWRVFPKNGWYSLLLANLAHRIGFHLFFVGDDRYHHSIMPIIAIFAAVGFVWIYERRKAYRV